MTERVDKRRVERFSDDETLLGAVQRGCFKLWNDPHEPGSLEHPEPRFPWTDESDQTVRELIGGPAGPLHYVRKARSARPQGRGGHRFTEEEQKRITDGIYKIRSDSRYESTDDKYCTELLRDLPVLLRLLRGEIAAGKNGWIAKARSMLDALQLDSPLDDTPAVRLVNALVAYADILPETPEVPDPKKDEDRRQEIMFAVATRLGRGPEANELAWATILCGVRPKLRPAPVSREAKERRERTRETRATPSEVIIAESKVARGNLAKYRDELLKMLASLGAP